MRRLYIGLVVAATTILFPLWAMASNQEVAEEIAASLRKRAQLHHYRIGVRFQNGTAWLKGYVSSPKQVKKVLHAVSSTPGVDRVVNNLTVNSSVSKQAKKPARKSLANSLKSTPILRIPGGPMAPEKLSPIAGNGHRAAVQRHSGKASHPALRLQQVVDAKSGPLVQANPVPSSYMAAPLQRVSAVEEQPQLVPQLMNPQPVRQRQMVRQQVVRSNRPIPVAYSQPCPPRPMPAQNYVQGYGVAGITPARYDQPNVPNYAWPSYAAYPNYAAVTYPRQYSPSCWPYMGPFYPYPQVPLGWRKVTLEWDDGWWMPDFKDNCH